MPVLAAAVGRSRRGSGTVSDSLSALLIALLDLRTRSEEPS